MRRTLLLALLALVAAAPAHADTKKAISGPVEQDATSLFPTYHALGAGIYTATLDWSAIAEFQPERARDPDDPSYDWPAEIDEAIYEAAHNHLQVALTLTGAPGWANGGHPARYAPKQASDYADFAVAAARRYPGVRLWIAWHDPSREANLHPASPARYAPLLDAAYGALKSVSKRNRVIGGGSYATNAKRWLARLKLPGGGRPRMDLYGHDPRASLKRLAALHKRAGKPLFLTGWTPATPKQVTAGLKLVHKAPYVYTLGTDFSALEAPDGTHTKLYAPFRRG